MKSALGTLFKTPGLKNIVTIITGAFFAQVVNGLTLLLVARFFYGPNSFGILAYYLSIFGIVSLFPTLRYTHAILLADSEEESKKISEGCIILSAAVSLGLLLFLLTSSDKLLTLLGFSAINSLIFFLPVHVFLWGINETLLALCNRKKFFRSISFNRFFIAIVSAFSLMFFGYCMRGNPLGLIISPIIALIFANLILNRRIKLRSVQGLLQLSRYRTSFYRYRKFALAGLPSDVLNVLTNQLPVYMFGLLVFNVESVGHYNLSSRLLSLPVLIAGFGITEVFRHKAVEERKQKGNYSETYLSMIKILCILGIVPMFLWVFWGNEIFKLFLGEGWQEAGYIAEILAPFYFLRLMASPLSYAFNISERQGELLLWNFYLLVSSILVFMLFHDQGMLPLLKVFAINYSFVYIFFLWRSYKFANLNYQDKL